ncbi:hypothetical protein RM844_00510 [Streptomyces sp. DSM 44915]|uniref:Uncharacterized protein n=1 Tax=Streptomyces chisholmiae TaxID=3075540 RepID=A0ABU2JIE8_9ACTN|nr:hypothetical protein [Streptomyces sp. DSM 44915]MDT0264765.1 hypothetical protein [Streptomyces sp. DSM 44915]
MDGERPHPPLRLPEGNWWDWDVVAWDAGEFRLAAGYSVYHHDLELVFGEPLFVSCPTEFRDPVFRSPTAAELASVRRRSAAGRPPVLVAFEADADGAEPATGLVAARRLELRAETVLRYWRADAAPGQRFAPWVRPPAD